MEIPEFTEILQEITEIKNMFAAEKAQKDFDSKLSSQWYTIRNVGN